VTVMLDAERSTLFLNDNKTNELFSELSQGLDAFQIRIPNDQGIAGAVFQSGEIINIPYAYADMRFNPSLDKKTGYFTRNILCSPIINKNGERIGVTQVLNKKGGIFTHADEARLAGFTSQIAIALENAKLFDDIQNIKNYNEIMLESMTNAVITTDELGIIHTCNKSGLDLLQCTIDEIKNKAFTHLFTGKNEWVVELVNETKQSLKSSFMMDQPLEIKGKILSVNLTTLPLNNAKNETMGTLLMFDDISKEKRLRTTMSRYMNPTLANQLIDSGELVLGGKSGTGTVLFSDIRSFTTLSEQLGPEGTVNLLNNYFTLMVECISEQDGMLDKFIGDAIMALFGVPIKHEDDPDRAVRCAINMIKILNQFNVERAKIQLLPVDIGIGINTGEIVTGNIGSPKRMEFTAIGDGVNLASRLESACKQYGAHIIVSEFTMRALKGTYRNRKIDNVIVKGKTEAVAIYEILDFHDNTTFPNIMEALNYFQSGINYYTEGNWDDAINMFKNAESLNPQDKLTEIYMERCRYLKKTKPADWKGIWVMTKK
jgi:adenylate cyclase